LIYAGTYMFRHSQIAERHEVSQAHLSTFFVWSETQFLRVISQLFGQADRKSVFHVGNFFHVLAAYGITTAIEAIFDDSDAIDINSRDQLGETPLSWAAEHGHTQTISSLLRIGKNRKPYNWLTKAFFGPRDIIIDHRDGKNYDAPLTRAAANGHYESARLLVDTKKADLHSAFLEAACYGHTDLVKFLLSRGAKASTVNQYKENTLSLAAIRNHPNMVRLLLEKGIHPDLREFTFGRTPLASTSKLGHYEVVQILASSGRVNVIALNSKKITRKKERLCD